MDAVNKPLRGMAIVRKLLEVKEQEQKASKENYRSNPEVRAIIDDLKQRNAQRRISR
ncbi:hypothetical protein BN8_03943 [Fibrisoma limi BUZ 3]|uniref:Uncharacterized protein n=1 Tax=Fibrisoma limi BUZ 3 TaxID=1185876 RepID=I2GLG5_9BACT|nr:hypothetical protein [Fibrisoma limi]CCH54741.1 hypothetical protein BN8_03943 [Fibrisoma limi BUZ 3]